MCLFFDLYASDDQGRYVSGRTYISFQKYKWAHFPGRKSFSFFLRAPYILRTTSFSGDNGGRRCQELKPHCSEKVEVACRIRIHGARGLAVGDRPPIPSWVYMGRTTGGNPARKIKLYIARLQAVLDIVIVPNRTLYL